MALDQGSQFQQKTLTLVLVSTSVTITEAMGCVAFYVLNKSTSTTNGTINGGSNQGQYTSGNLTILPGGERDFQASNGCTLVGQVITSPDSSCTLELVILMGSNS